MLLEVRLFIHNVFHRRLNSDKLFYKCIMLFSTVVLINQNYTETSRKINILWHCLAIYVRNYISQIFIIEEYDMCKVYIPWCATYT